MSRLSTHVLDTSKGEPAAGVVLALSRIAADGSRTELLRTSTNADGRTDRPLLDDLEIGTYEITFAMGDYFRGRGVALPDPPFLDLVPIRFGIADASAHCHVPLLASPWAFSTYRGS